MKATTIALLLCCSTLSARLGAAAIPSGTAALAGIKRSNLPATGVTFRTTDIDLQRLYESAEKEASANVVQFIPGTLIFSEGGGYGPNAWIESQPMEGEMYAKRDVSVALNNQLIFILGQRADGRLPGMLVSGDTMRKSGWDKNPPFWFKGLDWAPGEDFLGAYGWLQGYYFPEPAWRMYFWCGKDTEYLRRLYATLEAHDNFLWRTRDSNRDGLLETWCVWDTGEDDSSRLLTRGAPSSWPFDQPPGTEGLPDPRDVDAFQRYWHYQYSKKLPVPTREDIRVPFASMDVMGYSYAGRTALAKIARELGNSRENFWREQAENVRQRLITGLWDPQRHACFDRDREGRQLPELVHNNLQCMWYGIFTQKMADEFIRYHLLNPDEFWTPYPLVSIAVNEPLFQNVPGNSWSGQPQALTYQRAIDALENYGHYSEVPLIGAKLLAALIRNGFTFPQQLDPTTGTPSGPKPDGYGPMILTSLEYISRMYGIQLDVEHGRVWWSCVPDEEHNFTYTQRWGDRNYVLSLQDKSVQAQLDGRPLFTCTSGVRIITDLLGNVVEVVGIASEEVPVTLVTTSDRWTFRVAPNQVFQITEKGPELKGSAPFALPGRPK
jgi:hypothetical protein